MTKKVFVILLVLCTLFCYTTSACAYVSLPILLQDAPLDSDAPLDENYYVYTYTPTQSVYRLVTTRIEQPDGTYMESVNPMCVGYVTYKYTICVGKVSGLITSTSVNLTNYPQTSNSNDSRLNAQLTVAARPTQGYVRPSADGRSYTVFIAGGSLSITYNKVLTYDFNNVLVDTERVTESAVFSFSDSGTPGIN